MSDELQLGIVVTYFSNYDYVGGGLWTIHANGYGKSICQNIDMSECRPGNQCPHSYHRISHDSASVDVRYTSCIEGVIQKFIRSVQPICIDLKIWMVDAGTFSYLVPSVNIKINTLRIRAIELGSFFSVCKTFTDVNNIVINGSEFIKYYGLVLKKRINLHTNVLNILIYGRSIEPFFYDSMLLDFIVAEQKIVQVNCVCISTGNFLEEIICTNVLKNRLNQCKLSDLCKLKVDRHVMLQQKMNMMID